MLIWLVACGGGPTTPPPSEAPVVAASSPKDAALSSPDAACCCATWVGSSIDSCERATGATCQPFNKGRTRVSCMNAEETERLHTDYRRVAATDAEHKAKGNADALSTGSEMEGSWLLSQTPTIECVRACGDGVHGPDGAPIIAYE